MDHPLTCGITANLTKTGAVERTRDILDRLRQLGVDVFMEERTAEAAGESGGLALLEMAQQVELIVVVGGDGTILHAARELGPAVRPLAGINTGRLGFLTAATEGEADRFVRALANREFRLSRRSLIQARFDARDGPREMCGLNEVAFSRGAVSRMIRLEASINGESLNRFSGDGLIVATPTGSTAYSLSAGGPLINPEAGVFVITPICPHALAARSFVVNDDVSIEVKADPTQKEEIWITIDGGQGFPLKRRSTVHLKRATHEVPLVMLNGSSFYTILQEKLRWMGSSV
jgi:NAD+ kinase